MKVRRLEPHLVKLGKCLDKTPNGRIWRSMEVQAIVALRRKMAVLTGARQVG